MSEQENKRGMMENKKFQWQLEHEAKGYEVERIQSGQVRRYGPTISVYIVKDLTGERTDQEVREYCTTKVEKAHDPRQHPLINHLLSFGPTDEPHIYRYKCGHEYTG